MYTEIRLNLKKKQPYNAQFYIIDSKFIIPKVVCKQKLYLDIKYDKSGNIKVYDDVTGKYVKLLKRGGGVDDDDAFLQGLQKINVNTTPLINGDTTPTNGISNSLHSQNYSDRFANKTNQAIRQPDFTCEKNATYGITQDAGTCWLNAAMNCLVLPDKIRQYLKINRLQLTLEVLERDTRAAIIGMDNIKIRLASLYSKMMLNIDENEGGFSTDAITSLIPTDMYTPLVYISDSTNVHVPADCKHLIVLFNSQTIIPEIKGYSVQSACITLMTGKNERHFICGFVCNGDQYIYDSAGNGDDTGDHTNSIFEQENFTIRPKLPKYLEIKNKLNKYNKKEQYLVKSDYIYDFVIYFKNPVDEPR